MNSQRDDDSAPLTWLGGIASGFAALWSVVTQATQPESSSTASQATDETDYVHIPCSFIASDSDDEAVGELTTLLSRLSLVDAPASRPGPSPTRAQNAVPGPRSPPSRPARAVSNILQSPGKQLQAQSPTARKRLPRHSDPVPSPVPTLEPGAGALRTPAENAELRESAPKEPHFLGMLKPWQIADLERIQEREENTLDVPQDGTSTPLNGTLLVWDTGMGKTVVTISLICSTKKSFGPTLILCPNVEIVRQWCDEIRRFSENLTVLFYHAEDLDFTEYKKDPSDIKSFDVVLATYNQVLHRHSYMIKARGEELPLVEKQFPFYFVKWGRVVADESHTMRNPQGKTAVACCALQKRAGLALTATPIQNYPCDLQPQLKFLGRDYEELGKMKDFDAMWGKWYPYQASKSATVFMKIADVLSECIIYRPKISRTGLPCIGFPNRHDYEPYRADLPDDEARLYRYVLEEHEHKGQLAKLTRLRQACVDPKLILRTLLPDEGELGGGDEDGSIERMAAEMTKVGPSLHDSHVVSGELIAGALPHSIAHLAHLFDASYVSASIQTALDILKKISVRSRGDDKTIVYSTFRGPLETLRMHLTAAGVASVIYYGGMRSQDRQAALQSIKMDKSCKVLLMTIQSGSMGLNITSCNNVVLLEPWWNPYLEEQAVGRVYRIGQEKEVHVYRIVVEDTIQTEKMVSDKKRENIDKLLRDVETA